MSIMKACICMSVNVFCSSSSKLTRHESFQRHCTNSIPLSLFLSKSPYSDTTRLSKRFIPTDMLKRLRVSYRALVRARISASIIPPPLRSPILDSAFSLTRLTLTNLRTQGREVGKHGTVLWWRKIWARVIRRTADLADLACYGAANL